MSATSSQRNFTRLQSGKPWNLVNLLNHDQVCKDVTRWQTYPAITLPSTSSTNMQRYNTTSNTNMAFTDASNSFFAGVQDPGTFTMDAVDGSTTHGDGSSGRNILASGFTNLDPSAAFPGLGELPSDSTVDTTNLHGTFTADLNASAHYDVTDDHSQLLQEMLQQQAGHTTQTPPPQGGASSSAWEDSLHVLQEMLLMQQQQQAQQIYQSQAEQVFSHAYNTTDHTPPSYTKQNTNFPGESELLSLLQLPRTSNSVSGRGKGPLYPSGPVNTGEFFESRLGLHHHGGGGFFQSLPRGQTTGPVLLDLEGERDEVGDGKVGASTSPFGMKRGEQHKGSGGGGGEARGVNHFATERQRREFLNEKYQTLRSLVPNPTKADRASIVADAIDYVKELKRTVQELQLLIQEKRRASGGFSRKRSHRAMDQLPPGDVDQSTTDSASNLIIPAHSGSFIHKLGGEGPDGSHLRSSWLQRTSQSGTQVDVRIVHDEVTIKLTQRRRKNCLLDVFGVLLELQLEVLQASGASIGEHHVFLFNTKILEGSSTFAGYIAAKMLDAVDHRPLM